MRATWLVTVALLTSLVVDHGSWPTAARALSLPRQGESAQVVEVGSGPPGERSFAFSGQSLQRADTVTFFGIVTAVVGLEPQSLYAGATPAVAAARFTFSGEVKIAKVANRGDVSTASGSGTLRVNYNEAGGATWSDPASFAAGTAVGEWSVQVTETVQRQAPGVGAVVGDGQLTQSAANPFTLDAGSYRFGKSGIEQRIRYVGALAPGAEAGATRIVMLTGNVSVTANRVRPVPLGGPATPAASATPQQAAAACPAFEPWLTQSRDALAKSAALAAQVGSGATVSSLDAAGMQQAAQEAAALVDAQRALAVPDGAANANRLAITALSTTARGLQAVASAAANQDPALLSEGQGVLADGASLTGRANDAIAALAGSCAGNS